MTLKICKNCNKEYYEGPSDPVTFFCTNRCANAFSNSPEKAKHKRIQAVLLFRESEHWEKLNSEIEENSYQHITRLARNAIKYTLSLDEILI